MHPLKTLLQNRQIKKVNTNKTYLLAEQIAQVTDTKPQRWLRACKNYEYMNARLANFKEILKTTTPRNKIGYFIWLTKQ